MERYIPLCKADTAVTILRCHSSAYNANNKEILSVRFESDTKGTNGWGTAMKCSETSTNCKNTHRFRKNFETDEEFRYLAELVGHKMLW